MHYRQPWVCAVEEEIGFLKTRVEKSEEHKSLVIKLEVENLVLKVSCLLYFLYYLGYVYAFNSLYNIFNICRQRWRSS